MENINFKSIYVFNYPLEYAILQDDLLVFCTQNIKTEPSKKTIFAFVDKYVWPKIEHYVLLDVV